MAAWEWADSSIVLDYSVPPGFMFACSIGTFVYYAGYSTASLGADSRVLRYNSSGEISDPMSWAMVNVSTFFAGAGGFFGCIADSRYAYFVPYALNNTLVSGRTMRYDSTLSFTNKNSWVGFDLNGADGLSVAGFRGG